MKTNKKSILIVEDDENIANAQKLILGDEFAIHHARDGEEGLKKAEKIKPSLIILDLMLPKIDGYSVCKRIRANDKIKDTKILMVTAKDKSIDEIRGMNLGADDYIIKPFEADELKHVISQVLNR